MKRGFALLAAIFVVLVFGVLTVGFVTLFFSESRLAVDEYRHTKAFYVAEAGMNFAIRHLDSYADWSVDMGFPLTRSFGGGVFTLSTSEESGDEIQVYSTGLITFEGKTYSRTIRSTVSIAAGTGMTHNFDNAMYVGPPSGGSTLKVQNTAKIHGDFYYNGAVWLKDWSQHLAGTIYSTSLTISGGATYASWEAAEPVDMPIWNNSYYDSILAETNVSTTESLTLGVGQSIDLNGGTHYFRSIRVNTGGMVIGPGTLVATDSPGSGDILIDYGAGIGQGVRFIADSDFMYSASNLTNSIEVYVKDVCRVRNGLSVPAGSVLYSKSTGNDAIRIAGSVEADLLAPYGEVSFDYGTIHGLIYAGNVQFTNTGVIRGALVVSGSSHIGGTIDIYYDPAYLPDAIMGLGGTGHVTGEAGMSVSDWQEVY
ncbi:hypothetical protein ACFL31_02390 [Candidatus Margulisiibacteriota bacterium]